MYCPKCGSQVEVGTQFCQSCGAALDSQSAPQGQQPGAGAVTAGTTTRAHLPPYWQAVFQKFDQRPGQIQTHWNWPAFFFGPFWYLVKGMPAKGLLYILIAVATAGVGLVLAVYAGLYGAWDYYLKEVHGKQLW